MILLWLHVPAIIVFALVRGEPLPHALVEVAPVIVLGGLAARLTDRRWLSTVIAAVGLLTCSAILVHLSGGVIELHFHFFVMVGIFTLYQDWVPFLAAIGYVALHHGVIGALWPEEVYNHPAAIENPWTWAAIHAFFVLGLSAAGIISWQLNEVTGGVAHDREEELAESQRVAHLGSWEWDIAGNRISWSDELYRIFGLAPHELEPTYEGYLAHVHPDDVALVNGWVGAVLQGEECFEGDNRILRPGGEVAWIHARGEAVRDEEGTPVRLRGTVHDVTTSKLAEEALEKTNARYRLLQAMTSAANEASSIPEALQTAVGEIGAHTGWPVGHVYVPAEHDAGLLVSSGVWHMDEPARFGALRTATAATSFRAGEGLGKLMSHPAPSWVSDVTLDPTHARAGATPGFEARTHVAFPVRLATETVAVLEFFSEEALEPDHALLDTLGQVGTQLTRVAERQRASAELATARDAAMESSRLKSEFLATMSHEIRTPMNAVIVLTGLLLRTHLDHRQRQYAQGVEEGGEALLAVINDILDLSKIEAGKLELEVVDFDLVQVVEEAAGLVAETARRKSLELVAYCNPDVPAGLRGDPARLREVLLNLVSNAVKFTETGEVIVRARLVEESDEAVVVRFEVADTGIGIADSDRHRLFEPFSQADSSTTRRFGGTGLGLAISSQLVAAMGGELGVDSEPGRGSTF